MKVMVFFAHPDDETMLAGGILALLALTNVELHYLCATRGEGGEAGEPPICERSELGEVRAKEMACAVHTLGGGTLDFLDYQDPIVGEENELYSYTEDETGLKERVSAFIRRYSPEAIITHGSSGEYGHPAHIITHQAARTALQELNAGKDEKGAVRMYSVQAAFADHPKPRLANKMEPAHIVLDVQSVFERKVQAALCHLTQHALFVRRASKAAGRAVVIREVITTLESLHRVLPEFNDFSEDPLFTILNPWARDSSI
jgi:N-acetylglucosamine malate deacetylase 2